MECGGRGCGPLAFCHDSTNSCRNCSDICRPELAAHYEPGLCADRCRDYLIEQLRGPATDATARTLAAIALCLGIVAFVGVLLVLLGLAYWLHRPQRLLDLLQQRVARKRQEKEAERERQAKERDVEAEAGSLHKSRSMSNNNKCDITRDMNGSVYNVSGSISEPELRLHMAGAGAAPQQPVHMLTPNATPAPPARHPSEDSTLDYAAYDNPALSPSSSPLPPQPQPQPHGQAMDAVLSSVMDHSHSSCTLPGAVLSRGAGVGVAVGGNNAHRMESSF